MAGRFSKSKPLILIEFVIYSIILIRFLAWMLPMGFGNFH
jgi:hypothetical protein